MSRLHQLELVPLGRTAANEAITRIHRHHGAVAGFKFACGLKDGEEFVAVAAAGRPCRMLDDGLTLEVTRLATDGTENACSYLYSRCRRAAAALGYRKLITYTLPEEGGASLKAAGFVLENDSAGGGSRDRPASGRRREDKHPLEKKWRWGVAL